MISTADRRVDHEEQTFWEDSELPFGVLLQGTLACFKTRVRADRFKDTAIDSGRHRRVVLFVRESNETLIFEVDRRVTASHVLHERRDAMHWRDGK